MLEQDPRRAHRLICAAVLLCVGLVVFAFGALTQFRSRSDVEDTWSFLVMAVGASLVGAGVSLPFARPAGVLLIALLSPFLGYALAITAFWSIIVGIVILYDGPSQSEIVSSGYRTIRQAQEVDDLLGPARHQICNFKSANIAEWQTQVLFGGRYELLMCVNVEIDRESGRIEVVGAPQFQITEVRGIQGRTISYHGGHEFGVEEWSHVVEANGDFAVIGVHLELDDPVPGFAEYKKQWRSGMQILSGE